MNVSDPDLLARIAEGDRAAFASLYDRHAARVFSLLLRLMRNRAEAEDTLQETFLQVWSQADRYQASRAGALGWLLLLARSRGIERYRRERRRVAQSLCDEHDRVAAESPGRFDEVDSGESVRLMLATLPEEQRSAISLAFYGGLTHEEIAEQENLPLGTVKTRIRLGMRRLRIALDVREDAA